MMIAQYLLYENQTKKEKKKDLTEKQIHRPRNDFLAISKVKDLIKSRILNPQYYD